MEKFKDFSDEKLAYEVKKGDNDAQLEMLERYRNRVNVIAKTLYRQFRNAVICDLDDLIVVGMCSVIKASLNYRHGDSFNAFFSEIARNDMMDTIKDSSESYLSDNKFRFVSFDEMEEISGQFCDSSNDRSELFDAIIDAVNSDKIDADIKDKHIFIMYMSGMSIKEIARSRRLKSHVVKYKINSIAEKLAKLFKK